MNLTRDRQAKARRRPRETGEDQQWHQQILQREGYDKGTQSQGKKPFT
jgi:hypothetical protein